MPSLLVIIFVLEVVSHLVNSIGAATINSLLWTLLNYLPVSTSKTAKQHRQLQAEFLKVRKELNATSSQDEFAKWAKLRRTHDKLLDQLEKSKQSQEGAKSKFDTYLTGFRLLVTKVPQYGLPFWYSKEPMFWLPYGWFPYYAEWLMSFPKAPMGSVSIVSWQLACNGMVTLLTELITSILGLVLKAKQGQQQQGKAKVKVPAGAANAKSESAASAQQEKKEL
ncbi:Protein GET1 [Colletotrichum sp. SAR11_59]|uniref:CHD5 domain-containing protein n=1 Tax=Colletotrichum asianum TaxID=702518 RepID=A0A8H3ZK46_9PEZI|nr:Protein GET1 [Colletotrichum aenigma]KAF0318697.1 CHD5 domain-containing protein [Colletotrichum asianum]KAF4822809.1 Protein GET1 [Colletotrichum tropicale]KAF5526170.1 Protein GET1 [Colletotrichum aenigma]KAI8301050.1 Protein GET1 [Colletotrichum sp. SAR11_59]